MLKLQDAQVYMQIWLEEFYVKISSLNLSREICAQSFAVSNLIPIAPYLSMCCEFFRYPIISSGTMLFMEKLSPISMTPLDLCGALQ